MILVTGGAGYIGSHTCVALARAGLPFLILDNFSNSRRSVLERPARITGQPAPCVEGDVRDAALELKRGGVGYYASSDFVHLDTGRVRNW